MRELRRVCHTIHVAFDVTDEMVARGESLGVALLDDLMVRLREAMPRHRLQWDWAYGLTRHPGVHDPTSLLVPTAAVHETVRHQFNAALVVAQLGGKD